MGRIVGLTGIYVLAILLLIGGVVWLAESTGPDEPGQLVCTGPAGQTRCEYR